MFLITAKGGRGRGKTKLAEAVARLAGGAFAISANEDFGKVVGRLLTPDAMTKRIGLLDNVKSHRFSWDQLEQVVTADTISGHRYFTGEATRTNLMTWLITANGASMSTDLSARSVEIRLADPTYSADWLEDLLSFIDSNRAELVGDIVTFLRSPKKLLARTTRWATWEKEVLSRTYDPNVAVAMIEERRKSVDVESEEVEIIETYFPVAVRGRTLRNQLGSRIYSERCGFTMAAKGAGRAADCGSRWPKAWADRRRA